MLHRIKKIGMHILAFFVARCQVLGMYPFVVPFFMAAYIEEQSSFSLYVVMLLGILSSFDIVAGIKYALVLGILTLLFHHTNRKHIFSGDGQLALASGVILCFVGLPYQYIITRQDIWLYYSVLEGIIATCGILVFRHGLIALRVGTSRRFATNERFIGIFSLMIIFLFGCPKIFSPFHLLFLLSGYLLLYHCYRFDSGVSMTIGGITGICLSFQTGEISWLASMLILAGIVVILRELGKMGILMGFLAGYILLGLLYQNSLFQQNILISVLMVAFLFAITPSKWLKRGMPEKEGTTLYSQDLLVQEITKNRLQSYGMAFLKMEKLLLAHEEDAKVTIPNGLSNVYLSGDGISLLNAVESQSNRLMEIRRNFVMQLGKIGEGIFSLSGELSKSSFCSELFENKITEALSRRGILVTKAILVYNQDGKLEAYINCLLEKKTMITGEMLSVMVGNVLAKEMVCVKRGDENVTQKESTFLFVEKGKFVLTTGIVRNNRQGEKLCGDNFSIIKIDSGRVLLMISDGMGSGEVACEKSRQVVELLEQMLLSGFKEDLAVWLLNSFVSFLSDGRISSTIDITIIDLYEGFANFMKLGASTTFIKRKGETECIRSTSLPVGLLEQIEFDTCDRKLYHGDMIVMISDGIMDGVIFENKETYLADLITETNTNNVQIMAQTIVDDIRKMNRGNLRDDSTVLAVALWERDSSIWRK